MRPIFVPLALAISAGLFLAANVVMAPALVHATDKGRNKSPETTTKPVPVSPGTVKPSPRPKYAGTMPHLDISDEAATLEAVHLALSELGDGASYVWHRRGGNLSGIISPTASFRDPQGRVCRHLVMTLTAGSHTARTEGIACRMADKSWKLDG